MMFCNIDDVDEDDEEAPGDGGEIGGVSKMNCEGGDAQVSLPFDGGISMRNSLKSDDEELMVGDGVSRLGELPTSLFISLLNKSLRKSSGLTVW